MEEDFPDFCGLRKADLYIQSMGPKSEVSYNFFSQDFFNICISKVSIHYLIKTILETNINVHIVRRPFRF